jgi:phosphoglucosamine mutase
MIEREQPLSALVDGMEKVPQSIINVPVPNNFGSPAESIEAQSVQEALREAQNILGGEGRIVLRPSGTEPMIRVMVEGRDQSVVASLSQKLANVVAAVQDRT